MANGFEDLAAGFGGFGEGALAGRKVGLESEALDIRSDRVEGLNRERTARTDLLETQNDAAMLQLQELQKRQEMKETAITSLEARITKDFPTFSPRQIDFTMTLFNLRKPGALNELEGTNELDYTEFIEGLSDNPKEDASTMKELASIGIRENQPKIDGFKGDLQKFQDMSAKPGKEGTLLTTRQLGEMETLQGQIDALEEINAGNMSLFNMFSEQQKQGSLGRQALDLSSNQDYQEAKSILKQRMSETEDVTERQRLVQALIDALPLAAKDLLSDLEIKELLNQGSGINISPEALQQALLER